MTSTREEQPRRRFDRSFVILGMGLLFLFLSLNQPTIANMRFPDLVRLLGTGACLGIGLVGSVLHFLRKG
jgi:hypothetical protein